MRSERNNFYILTGGPGSGKTTIIEALRERGFRCVDEAGRQILQEQIKIGGDAVHWKNQVKYCDLMLSRSIHAFEQIAERERPVFFDRGIAELIGYCAMIKAEVPDYLRNAVEVFRYNPKVFVAPPWKEIYRNDAERKQTWEEAVEGYSAACECYPKCGYQLVEIPVGELAQRVEFILGHVGCVDR